MTNIVYEYSKISPFDFNIELAAGDFIGSMYQRNRRFYSRLLVPRGNAHFMDQWYFEQGIFKHKTEVYHGSPIVTSGRYRVLEFSEDSLVLELYDIDLSFGDEIQQVTIKIDLESDTIRTRSQIYERTLP